MAGGRINNCPVLGAERRGSSAGRRIRPASRRSRVHAIYKVLFQIPRRIISGPRIVARDFQISRTPRLLMRFGRADDPQTARIKRSASG